METRKYFKLMIFTITAIILLIQTSTVSACSCMPQHPQTTFCKSDYVIIARILRKSVRRIEQNDVYKIEIKKAYKMSNKAHHHLKDGRIITPSIESLCGGLQLNVGKLYLIAANSARVGICNFVKEYSKMTIVERRGFAGGYKKGCLCEIKPMFRVEGHHRAIGTCNWSPFSKCESDYGACVPARGIMTADGKPIKCHWRQSPPYNACRNENQP